MMNVFELVASITLNSSSYSRGIREARSENETLERSVQRVGHATSEQKARLDTLKSAYQSSANKVKDLSKELERTVASEGASSEKAQQLSQELSKAEKSANQAEKEFKDYERSLQEVGNETDQTTQKTETMGSKLSSVLGRIAKVGAAAMATAGTAVVGLTKSAVSAYGDYEQLVGGVETLFKDSAGIVQGYADQAYQTAGLSANEYMETVTGFSASLLQSLGGDTAKAAEYSDRAVKDMSDNANKMGTDMSSLQYAYQGFAKQNYTIN